MATILCCDICNKKIEDYEYSFETRVYLNDEECSEWTTKDICKDCYHNMLDYIKAKSSNKVDENNNINCFTTKLSTLIRGRRR